MSRPARYLLRSIGPILFLGLVWYADSARIREVWTNARPELLILAATLNLPIILVKAWRWRALMGLQGISYDYVHSVRQYAIGAAIAAWTPGRLGDFTKAVAVTRERKVSFGRAASSVIVDRVLDALAMVTFATAGIALIPELGPAAKAGFLLAGGAVLFVTGRFLLRPPEFSSSPRPVRAFVGLLGSLRSEIDATVEGLTALGRSRPLAPMVVTLPASLITFLQGYSIAVSLDLEIGFWRLAAALATSTLTSLVPITVAGIGTRELALILVLGSAGMTMAQVIGFSVNFLLVVQGSVAIVGALAWLLPPPR